MHCKKCGHYNEDDQNFCKKCGQQINDLDANEEPSEEDVLMKFVDKNQSFYSRKWDKIKEKGNGVSLNIAAFFLAIFWLGYRKMYKTVLFISLFYLAIDVVLYLVGYQYDPNNFIDPLDNSISIGVAVLFGLYGNQLYKNHAERQISILRESRDTSDETFKKKGGTSALGPILAFLILVGVYMIPSFFIPLNVDEIDTVKYTEFYDYPDVPIGELFDDLFVQGNWLHSESTDEYEIIEYTGEKVVDNYAHDISVVFISEHASEDVEVLYVVVDGEELDVYDSSDFIDYLFEEHEKTYEKSI